MRHALAQHLRHVTPRVALRHTRKTSHEHAACTRQRTHNSKISCMRAPGHTHKMRLVTHVHETCHTIEWKRVPVRVRVRVSEYLLMFPGQYMCVCDVNTHVCM